METRVSGPSLDGRDLGEHGKYVQSAVEIERFRLALGGADAVPEASHLFRPAGGRRQHRRMGRKPVIKSTMERLKGPVRRASAESLGEPGDSPRVGARQA